MTKIRLDPEVIVIERNPNALDIHNYYFILVTSREHAKRIQVLSDYDILVISSPEYQKLFSNLDSRRATWGELHCNKCDLPLNSIQDVVKHLKHLHQIVIKYPEVKKPEKKVIKF